MSLPPLSAELGAPWPKLPPLPPALPPLPQELHAAPTAFQYTIQAPAPALSISTKRIIDDINHAVTQSQRLQALSACRHAINHHDQAMHNYEMDLGAANALCLKLGYILQCHSSISNNTCWLDEVGTVLGCLRMVYRCSLDARIQSFRMIGKTELVPLLVQVLKRLSSCLQQQQQPVEQWLDALHETLFVLRILAKLDVAKSHLIQSAMLQSLLIQLVWSLETAQDYAWVDADRTGSPARIQLEIFGLWKDVTFRASDSDKLLLFQCKGWIPVLCHVAQPHTTCLSLRHAHEHVASVLWNLALSPTVSHEMAQRNEVLSLLQSLIQHNNNEESSSKTRRSAVSAIGNLASTRDNQEILLQREGLIEALMRVAKEADDADSRRRAMRTLRCLITCDGDMNHSNGAAARWRNQESFVQFLSQVASQESDASTRIQACECLGHVAQDDAAAELVGDLVVRAALETVERSGDCSKVTVVAFRVLTRCMERPAECPLVAIKLMPAEFFASLKRALVEHPTDAELHRSAGQFMMKLNHQEEEGCREKLMGTAALNLLALLLSRAGPEYEASRGDALQVICRLAETDTNNKRRLAEHEEIMTALVNVAVAAEGAEKAQAKNLILQLVPEL